MKSGQARRAAAGFAVFTAVILSLPVAAAPLPSFSEAPVTSGQSDFCAGQPDGTYQHPDCRVYYRCDKGGEAQVKCPEGQVFDPDKNPNDVAGRAYCGAPESVAHVDCSEVKLKRN
jgi:hypothetical protein